mmetsp:Transcript_16042/g.38279  ORF Transcript_16042/g.38279 Transcript_16042/m.38279 type:complete len:387 (-) Transcript_16042:137-1297(-)
MSGTRDGASGTASSSAASAAAAPAAASSSASSHQHHQQQQGSLDASEVPQVLTASVAQYVRSYSQLESLIEAHPAFFTPALLLPILMRLWPIVVASLGLGVFIQVPLPQLAHGTAVAMATNMLMQRLFILAHGGNWRRWIPHLTMIRWLQEGRPVHLVDEHFGVFGSPQEFLSEREAPRQWTILSRMVYVCVESDATWVLLGRGCSWHPLMRNNAIRVFISDRYVQPRLLDSPSPLFPPATFEPDNPPTQLDGYTYRTYACMVAFVLFDWLRNFRSPHMRFTLARRDTLDATHHVHQLLAVGCGPQWGGRAAVFDKRREEGGVNHTRLVVLGSEVLGEGHIAAIVVEREGRLSGGGHEYRVDVYTSELQPHDRTRSAMTEVLGTGA